MLLERVVSAGMEGEGSALVPASSDGMGLSAALVCPCFAHRRNRHVKSSKKDDVTLPTPESSRFSCRSQKRSQVCTLHRWSPTLMWDRRSRSLAARGGKKMGARERELKSTVKVASPAHARRVGRSDTTSSSGASTSMPLCRRRRGYTPWIRY